MEYLWLLFGVIASNYLKSCALPLTESTEPLILTPLIKAYKIHEAHAAAQVNSSIFKNITSYSGYLTVNEHFNSNLFFWFFPSEGNLQNDPVLLWLQGGPGSSSMMGLFAENGPFSIISESEVELREFRWSKNHSVIYIDNPVGTGFSFTNEDSFAQNETIIGEHLFEALQQFFTMFPELQKNEFYVTGESYAGKYVPAISYTIMRKNPSANLKINLQGLAIGNGLCDPINQLNYGDYLFELGLINQNSKQLLTKLEGQATNYIKAHDFQKAFAIFHKIIYENSQTDTLFREMTGFKNYYNYLHAENTMEKINKNIIMFLENPDVKKAIHVGNKPFDSTGVEKHMQIDVMKSVAPWISELLHNYRVLFYNGQLDIIIGYPSTVNFLQKLHFNGAAQYKTAQRIQWHVGNGLAGYITKGGNLTEVLVRNAGHLVPADQPEWAFDLISKFVQNRL